MTRGEQPRMARIERVEDRGSLQDVPDTDAAQREEPDGAHRPEEQPDHAGAVTLDEEEVAKLEPDADVHKLIGDHIDAINEKFARVEQIKKFAILPHDLSQEGGELTPTMKVKRKVVTEKYKKEIDKLYN